MLSYLKWLTIFVWIPTLVLWVWNFRVLKRYKKTLLICVGCALLFSIPWDLWAIGTHIWIFPPENIVGIWLFGIPLEEYLFITTVTVEICTLTLVLKYTVRKA